MAAPEWYTQEDKDIFKNNQFITQKNYRVGPYTTQGTTATTPTQNFGIPYTNAFTGGGGGGGGGNAFGYGTTIEPGGSFGSYGTPNYTGGLPGNVQQYGVGRQFTGDEEMMAPIAGETYSYKKTVPAWARTVGSFIPGGNFGLNYLEKRMNLNRDQPPGTYKIGGLDTGMKGLYDNLAGEQMLFEGPGGIKTLTGKNFAGPGYLEGQLELAKGFNFDTMSEEDIEKAIEDQRRYNMEQHHGSEGFKYKQMKEAWNVYKTNKAQTPDAIKEYEQKQARKKAIAEGKKYSASLDVAPQHHRDVASKAGDHQAQSFRSEKKEGIDTKGSGMHGGKHYADGGRIGFKDGAQFEAANQGMDISPGTTAGGEFRGGDNTPNINSVVPTNNYIDIKADLLRKKPYLNINARTPKDMAKLKASFQYKNLFDNDDLSVKGNLSTKLGKFNTNTDFTQAGIGDTSLNYNNLSALIGSNKDIKNIGYNTTRDGINYGINYGDGNTMFTVGTKFNNGGLARLL